MKKEPVVLLHCSGSSGAQWRSLAETLGPRYLAIAPDLASPGSLALEAAPIVERMREPVHLVGHSYGGAVALHIARTRPDLLRSLTLIEPTAFHLLRGGDAIDTRALHEIAEVAAQVKADLRAGDLLYGFGRFVDYWSGPGAWSAMPPAKRIALGPQLDKIARDFRALLDEPAGIADVRGLRLPILLLQGGCTALPARCVGKRLCDALPEALLSVVRGAGHMLPLTHREEVNWRIAAHLDRNRLELQAA